jgi:very-short-patch-repair endonuclease
MANEVARKLRRRMTRQEVKLWLHLRELRKLGFHFRRQVPIKDFIVDFACFNPRLLVELTAVNIRGHGMNLRMPFVTRS